MIAQCGDRPPGDPRGALPEVRESAEGAIVKIRVHPRSSRNAVCGVHNGALKVKVTPPAAQGKANAACLKVLAKALSLPKSSLTLTRGARERNKSVLIRGMSGEDVQGILLASLQRVSD